MKDFDRWNEEKKKIDKFGQFNHPKVREIWYLQIGVNVGSEIYGKGSKYLRPVLIINVDDADGCVGIPLTSKLRKRKYSKVIETPYKIQ